MEFRTVIETRRSIRKFKSDPISTEMLSRILDAGRLAPTWANKQGVRYIIIRQPDKIKAVADAIGQRWTQAVPLFVVVCIDPNNSGKNGNGLGYFSVDAAICLEHIILAAVNEGLGTCWIGSFDEAKVKDVCKIPKSMVVIGLTPLGFPDQTPSAQNRRALSEFIHYDEYGNK